MRSSGILATFENQPMADVNRYRSFLKRTGAPNIPIQAIGLSLYEQLPSHMTNGTNTPDSEVEAIGTKVTRTQWLDLSSLEMANLIGKNVLIVDEVDDTRTTLEYAVRELMKDVEEARKRSGRTDEESKTKFSIFVLHVCVVKILYAWLRTNILRRTRTRKSEDTCRLICWMRIDISLQSPLRTYG